MRITEAFTEFPEVSIFRVIDGDHENPSNWDIEPVDSRILLQVEDYYIVKAKNIRPDQSVIDCYIDISLIERISDYALFVTGEALEVDYHHKFDGDIVCAVAIDCQGSYELFYSTINPEIGLAILKEGLSVSQRKIYIAEDIAYILRDENRFQEAAEFFLVSAEGGASSHYIFREIAACFEEIGDVDRAKHYKQLFDIEEMDY